jgi:2-keto-4-pentenoate hydratase/2-oxohepta-3-ene-1,7-dioic acid hydratase in catechol pathway
MRITRATSSGRTRWQVTRDGASIEVVEEGADATLDAALSAGDRAGDVPASEDAERWRTCYPFEPHTILGIGLNYRRHAADLRAAQTELPTVFFKGRHTLIGPDDSIVIPADSTRVTAEAELGLVVGERMRNVDEARALDYIAGAVCVLDQTAEDILQKDSRLLMLSKNFETFFAFGPELITMDELVPPGATLDDVRIGTYRNGECVAEAAVADMRFAPATLLAFLSRVMPLEPGDVLSTGTPGAAVVAPGDVVECRIDTARKTPVRPLVLTVGSPAQTARSDAPT